MLGSSHVSSQFDQDSLDSIVALPLAQTGEDAAEYKASVVDTGQDDLCSESDLRGAVGVFGAASDFNAVDAVLVYGMGRAQDGAVPVGHEKIIGILETVAASLGAETLLALLELLQQAEVARDLGHDCYVGPVLAGEVLRLSRLLYTGRKRRAWAGG